MAVVVASGHVSDAALESTRRRLTAKQADTVERLGRAAVELLRREGFAGLTVRRVAAEAGVGALLAGKVPDVEGKTVAVVVSGGKVAGKTAAAILSSNEA